MTERVIRRTSEELSSSINCQVPPWIPALMSLPAETRRHPVLPCDRTVALHVPPKMRGRLEFSGQPADFLFMRSGALIESDIGTGKYADLKG